MSREIPKAEDTKAAMAKERRLSLDEVSDISQAESAIAGGGPIRQPPTAPAQNFYAKQRNFDDKVKEILQKSPDTITREDARELRSLESRVLGTVPGKQSLSAEVQSIAAGNEALAAAAAAASGSRIYGSNGAYITKEDAAEEQRHESHTFGGRIPKGSHASQMQSRADKLEHSRRRR
ncbi:hypothetical protein GX51_05308 [Blastomyces parvus]|uniref:SMP domain-containing protein n=1 Tax=Blastomyces parvus TaxID=2060905 RepID=A0A2B7WX45_9EURO|nr:hypothetical protein GX51_05308 [Blastomyces parvus]